MDLEKAEKIWIGLDKKWKEVRELQKEFDEGTKGRENLGRVLQNISDAKQRLRIVTDNHYDGKGDEGYIGV